MTLLGKPFHGYDSHVIQNLNTSCAMNMMERELIQFHNMHLSKTKIRKQSMQSMVTRSEQGPVYVNQIRFHPAVGMGMTQFKSLTSPHGRHTVSTR